MADYITLTSARTTEPDSAALLTTLRAIDPTTGVAGFAAGVDGQQLLVQSIGAGNVYFAHNSGSSSAGNKLTNQVTSGNTPICAAKGSALFIYDGTSTTWRLVNHYQGDWISVPYTSTDYTADSSTWTVDSGDLLGYRYMLHGTNLTVSFVTTATSVGAGNLRLFALLPNSWTFSVTVNTIGYANDNGTKTPTITQVNSGVSNSKIGILRLDLANWASSTNNSDISFTIHIPLT